MRPKITLIGGGAYVFSLRIIRDILAMPALRESTLCMYDIHEGRNRLNADAVQRVIDTHGFPTALEVTTDLKEAVANTDFFICGFQVGGLEAYGMDVEIPRRYGIDQCVGDTFGPGGIFRGLRSIEALRPIAAAIREHCPEALFLQYANPMAINTTGLSRLGVRNIGLCHSVQGTTRMLARTLGVPEEECSFITAGLNHQAWYMDFSHNGRDMLPQLRKVMVEKHITGENGGEAATEEYTGGPERVRTEIMRLTGYFHTEGSAHASEYLPYFRKTPDDVLTYQPHRWDFYELCRKRYEDRAGHAEAFIASCAPEKLAPGCEYGAWIIHAMVTGEMRLIHGSVMNRGSIKNLPDDVAVEIPIAVDRHGPRPQVIGNLPPACAAVSMTAVNQVQLAVEAALNGDIDLLYAAVALDPLTGAKLTLPGIREMVDEMIEAEQEWLPMLTSKTFLVA